ncbi:MAG: hypothetical protein WCO07_00090 [bacterium]
MNKECQNCKTNFEITSDDFGFYERIKVPPPTFCPECRFQRRMTWRNERTLYKRACDLCQKDMISMYPKDAISPVYCKECWYSDNWDATSYGRDYDFSKNFFEQWKDLSLVVPRLGLWQRSTLNSPYSNMVGESKNVYLSTSVVLGSENIFYSRIVDKSYDILDSYNIIESNGLYENIECEKNYNSQNLILSRNCLDSYFLIDCVNCSNCVLSSNLRNKEFYFRNKKYSKEDYFKEIEKLNLGSRKSRGILIKEFDDLCKKAIYRFANITKSVDSTGNNLLNAKNCKDCFECSNSENLKYNYRSIGMKDSLDTFFGGWSELIYEYTTGCLNDYNVKFSYSAMNQVRDGEYLEYCMSSKKLFGCISIKNKENVILNKIYKKKEYEELIKKIKKHMEEMPYIDKGGRVYKYGEFFPIELSAFAYNETCAQDFLPLTKEEALKMGYRWKDPEPKNYTISIKAEDIPDNIKDVKEEILDEVLGCLDEGKCNHQCMTAFRLTKDEFQFYKKHNIPIPNKCSNCRYYERFAKILPPKLWHRKCMREGCFNEFETSYAPDRPEIIYCERCYQQEVY